MAYLMNDHNILAIILQQTYTLRKQYIYIYTQWLIKEMLHDKVQLSLVS